MFKFKKTKEIKPDETKKVNNQKEEDFLKMKPEAGMTKLEALCFWDEMCSHRGV